MGGGFLEQQTLYIPISSQNLKEYKEHSLNAVIFFFWPNALLWKPEEVRITKTEMISSTKQHLRLIRHFHYSIKAKPDLSSSKILPLKPSLALFLASTRLWLTQSIQNLKIPFLFFCPKFSKVNLRHGNSGFLL